MPDPAPPSSLRQRKRVFLLLMILIVLSVPFLATEAFVRIIYGKNSPDTVRKNSLQYVATIFARHMLKPHQKVRVEEAWGLRPGEVRPDTEYRINALGYRGRSLEGPRRKNTSRIVILGGSAVFDPGATEGMDWPHRVEEKLREMGHEEAEVLNAGVPGHATFDSLGRLYSQIWTLEPDYVLVYEAWNDIKSFTEVSREHPLLWTVQPFDPGADPFQNYRNWVDRMMCLSQVYVKLRNMYFMSRLHPGPEGAARTGERRDWFDDLAVRQYHLNLDLLVDGAKNVGAVPVLMTQGTLLTHESPEADRRKVNYEYQGLNHEGLVRAFQACREEVLRVAGEKDVGVVDAAAVLNGRGELFADHVHLSPEGGRVLSGLVADYLDREFEGRNVSGLRRPAGEGREEKVHGSVR